MTTQQTLSMVRPAAQTSPFTPIDEALRAIFSTPAQETLLQKTRHTMGDTVSELSDDELESYITEFQHLIDYWLDTFEKDLFDGVTLQQLLREG
jgi:hypothetical protein